MVANQRVRPPFDPELEAALKVVGVPTTLTPEMIPIRRAAPYPAQAEMTALLKDRGFVWEDVTIAGYKGDDILVSVVRKAGRVGTGPGFYHSHGGGMVFGDRWLGAYRYLDWLERFNGVLVTVEYRVAPEFPHPYPVEDAYAGFVWTSENAERLGIDPDRIVVGGVSAGGGITAGLTLMARDRQGPTALGQLLICPMLDDRNETVSSHQMVGVGVWDRGANHTGWSALLGDRVGTADVSPYAAPARAEDLSRLPAAFIDCGSAEVFRDEDVAYATSLWRSGVQAELHVWAGGFHAFDSLAPHAAVSKAAHAASNSWMDRLLGE